MRAHSMRVAVALALAVGIVIAAAPAGARPSARVCDLVTPDELDTALGSTFGSGKRYVAGTGVTCGFEGTGAVRGATVRIARGRLAKGAMVRTLAAVRDNLRAVGSDPPKKVAGLGDRAYYSLDEFLDEGMVEVLDGTTFVQVTAILEPGSDAGFVSEAVLTGLAAKALARA